jgi:hypothetical protein
MKKNGFTPILIVLIIAVLGVVGYFWVQSRQLENYSNSKYGFEFYYPKEAKSDFGLDKITPEDNTVEFFSLGFEGGKPPGDIYVTLHIDKRDGCDTTVSGSSLPLHEWAIKDMTSRTVSMGGVETIVYEGRGDKNTVANEYMADTCIAKAGYTYTLIAQPDSKHKDFARKLFWQIIKSFKFTQ